MDWTYVPSDWKIRLNKYKSTFKERINPSYKEDVIFKDNLY